MIIKFRLASGNEDVLETTVTKYGVFWDIPFECYDLSQLPDADMLRSLCEEKCRQVETQVINDYSNGHEKEKELVTNFIQTKLPRRLRYSWFFHRPPPSTQLDMITHQTQELVSGSNVEDLIKQSPQYLSMYELILLMRIWPNYTLEGCSISKPPTHDWPASWHLDFFASPLQASTSTLAMSCTSL